MTMAADFLELNIVLFDLDGDKQTSEGVTASGGLQDSGEDGVGKRTGAAESRRESMKYILDKVLEKRLPNFFFLCQDNIGKKKHEILMEKLGNGAATLTDPTFARPAEAGVYYSSNQNQDVDHKVDFISHESLEKVQLTMRLTRDDPFLYLKGLSRLMACVLTPKGTAAGKERILLVSWHGPHKTKNPDATLQLDSKEAKRICFLELVHFLDRLKQDRSCDVVIVGGGFNWPAEEAREEMDRIGRVNGIVTADYTTTTDRQDLGESGMIDYIVCWPKDSIHKIEANVECGEYRRERPRPFNHPIVRYQVKLRDLTTAMAKVSLTDQPQREDAPPSAE